MHVKRIVLVMAVLVIAGFGPLSARGMTHKVHAKQAPAKTAQAQKHLQAKLHYYQYAAHYWQSQALLPPTSPPSAHRRSVAGVEGLREQVLRWKDWANQARIHAQNPPHKSDWLCIHHYEGSWQDHGSPYWGGLQMNLTFQQSYAKNLYKQKGTADNWTPLQQMWAAEQAFKSRKFGPWPNTARYCGLTA